MLIDPIDTSLKCVFLQFPLSFTLASVKIRNLEISGHINQNTALVSLIQELQSEKKFLKTLTDGLEMFLLCMNPKTH